MAVLQRFASAFSPVVLLALLAGGCAKSGGGGAPLTYAPADTPYLFANSDPLPQAIWDRYSTQMAELWPVLMPRYQHMLDTMTTLSAARTPPDPNAVVATRVAQALLDEIKPRDSVSKLREIGLKTDGRFAFYGVGPIPVLRGELGDVDGFKAMVARVQQKSGTQLGVAKLDAQDYWTITADKVQILMAIEDHQLVLTLCPTAAGDDLRRTLLGLRAPQKNALDAGLLAAIEKKNNFLGTGSGFFDVVRMTDLITSASDPVLQQFGQALGDPVKSAEPACRDDYHTLALMLPRIDVGYEALTAQRVQAAAMVELAPGIAADLLAAAGSAPGTAAPAEGLMDVSLALPILKLKDFWQKQLGAIAAKPFTCSTLVGLNKQATDARTSLDTTIPPPFSDLTGARFVLTRLEPKTGSAIPDYSGKFFLGLNTPMTSVAMAQLVLPSVKDLKLQPDGKPVAVPTGALGAALPPVFAAMAEHALALSFGPGEETSLGAFLNAPSATQPIFMRMSFSGEIYGLMSKFQDIITARMEPAQKADMQDSAQTMAMMQKWLRRVEFRGTATASGVLFEETVDLN